MVNTTAFSHIYPPS